MIGADSANNIKPLVGIDCKGRDVVIATDADDKGDKAAGEIAKALGFYGLRFHGPSGLFLPDSKAAAAMKPDKANHRANLDKIKTEVRRLVMRRKHPFTSRRQIADLIDLRRGDVLAAIDALFEAGELSQNGQRKPIAFGPPEDRS